MVYPINPTNTMQCSVIQTTEQQNHFYPSKTP